MTHPAKQGRIILLLVGGTLFGVGLGFLLGRVSAHAQSAPVENATPGGGATLSPPSTQEVAIGDMPGASVYRRGGVVGLKLPDYSTVEFRQGDGGVGWVRYDFSMGGYKHHGSVNSNGARHGQWSIERPDRSVEMTYWFMGRRVTENELDRLMAEQPNEGW